MEDAFAAERQTDNWSVPLSKGLFGVSCCVQRRSKFSTLLSVDLAWLGLGHFCLALRGKSFFFFLSAQLPNMSLSHWHRQLISSLLPFDPLLVIA